MWISIFSNFFELYYISNFYELLNFKLISSNFAQLCQTDNHASTQPLRVFQAGCPSCRPTNNIKALKAFKNTQLQKIHKYKYSIKIKYTADVDKAYAMFSNT